MLTYAPDGFWVITIGSFGLFGFIALFGLTLSVFSAARGGKFAETVEDKLFLAALALIVPLDLASDGCAVRTLRGLATVLSNSGGEDCNNAFRCLAA